MSSSPFTYLITGANRGLGYVYSKALLAAKPNIRIVAAARDPAGSEQLQTLKKENEGRVYLLKLEVTDPEQAKQAAKELEDSDFLRDGGIDALANVAGVAVNFAPPSQLTKKDILDNLKVNVFGVLAVTEAFLPLVRKSKAKQIFNVSSTVGSIEMHGPIPALTAYAISKTALNMYTKKLASELGPEGFTVVPFCPGYVRTDMNKTPDGQNGELEPEEAANLAVKNVFLKVTPADNGVFYAQDGAVRPW
ncbi:hypothetical protein JCM8547_005405 [Rhodosporidiobolus lusitaniae]